MMLFDTFSNINSIIEQDKTVTPYKYSLLKGVIETCQEYPQYVSVQNTRVELPLGICVLKWMMYYYPFFLPNQFISLQNGEQKGAPKIAFRDEFEAVCVYYEQHGGISALYDDLMHDTVSPKINAMVSKLVNKLKVTIVNMPMKHLGFSLHQKQYAVFKQETRGDALRGTEPVSFRSIVASCGTYSISEELYVVFRDLGGFILGSGTVQQKWLDFLRHKNTMIPESELMRLLSQRPVIQRDVSKATVVYERTVQSHPMSCVWSGRPLTMDTFRVDHLLPFSLWKSNELWNLIPVHYTINQQKSDKIALRSLLERRKEDIFTCWDTLHDTYPKRFEEGIAVGLLKGEFTRTWQEDAFGQICDITDYLIKSRGCPPWKGPCL